MQFSSLGDVFFHRILWQILPSCNQFQVESRSLMNTDYSDLEIIAVNFASFLQEVLE